MNRNLIGIKNFVSITIEMSGKKVNTLEFFTKKNIILKKVKIKQIPH